MDPLTVTAYPTYCGDGRLSPRCAFFDRRCDLCPERVSHDGGESGEYSESTGREPDKAVGDDKSGRDKWGHNGENAKAVKTFARMGKT